MNNPFTPTVQQKVQVWIYRWDADARSFLFLLLKTNPQRGAFWQPITGGAESHETLKDAAAREAKEETGLSISESPEEIPHSFQFESRGKWVNESGFSIQVASDFPVQLDPQEHTRYQWVSADEAFQMLGYSSNAQMLRTLLDQLQVKSA